MAAQETVPRDARAVAAVLKSMGVEEYEPRVINQLLEFSFRYITDVLSDARVYSEHAGKHVIDVDDLNLAVQAKANNSFSQPPPRELLLELASLRNTVPIPPISTLYGLPLPPEEDTLLQPNYQIVPPINSLQKDGSSAQQPSAAASSPAEPTTAAAVVTAATASQQPEDARADQAGAAEDAEMAEAGAELADDISGVLERELQGSLEMEMEEQPKRVSFQLKPKK